MQDKQVTPPATFYRVAHDITGQGLWYKSTGEFTGLIHGQLNFCANKELQMPFDENVVGYLSATKTIDELLLWFPVKDIERLEDFGFFITEYTATDYKEYRNHWLIKQSDSVVVKTIPVAEVTPAALKEEYTVQDFNTSITDIYGLDGSKDLTLDEYYKLTEAHQSKFVKVYYKNTGYNVATDPVKWEPTTEQDYNKHNPSYRKIMYRQVTPPASPLEGKEKPEQTREWFNNTAEAEKFLIAHDWKDKHGEIPFYKVAILLNRFRGLSIITTGNKSIETSVVGKPITESVEQLKSQLIRTNQHKELIKNCWLNSSAELYRYKEAIKDYLDSENGYTFEKFVEDFELETASTTPTTLLSEGKERIEEAALKYAESKWGRKVDTNPTTVRDFISGAQWQAQNTAKEIADLKERVSKLENMLKYASNGYSTLIEYGILNDRYRDDAQVIIDKIESVF